jgi:hypothetical protein
MTTGHEGMSYTEQMLDVLDDFDTAGGFHIKYVGPDLWKISLGKARVPAVYLVKEPMYSVAEPVDEALGSFWGAGPSRASASTDAQTSRRSAEEALEACFEKLRSWDAQRRLGALGRP